MNTKLPKKILKFMATSHSDECFLSAKSEPFDVKAKKYFPLNSSQSNVRFWPKADFDLSQ
jgi:hypothetical protein